jgi:putative transposase
MAISSSAAESESERLCRTLDLFRAVRMPTKLNLFGEASLRRALTEYIDPSHFERNHQGKGNFLLFHSPDVVPKCRTVHRRDRLGGLLKFYFRAA